MRKLAVTLTVVLFTFGCESVDKDAKEKLKDGVVDACYTTLEYGSSSYEERINKYLEARLSSKTISKEEKAMIERCLERTKKSSRWGK